MAGKISVIMAPKVLGSGKRHRDGGLPWERSSFGVLPNEGPRPGGSS